jgi:hypothetical protein
VDPQTEWRRLLETPPDLDRAASVLEGLQERADELLGAGLLGATDTVLDALIRCDDASLRARLLEPLPPLLERARRVAADDVPIVGLGITASGTLLASAGLGDDPRPLLEPWIPRAIAARAALGDTDLTTLALACAALGFDDAVHDVLSEPPLRYEPHASFGPDARSYARYLVAAAAAGATADEIARAWTSLVSYVPVRLETRGLRWTDLLFAGYGTYARIAGNEPHEVLDAINAFVRDLVAL